MRISRLLRERQPREARLVHVPPMPEAKLLEAFAGARESAWLPAVLYVLRRLEEGAKAEACVVDQPEWLAGKHTARMGAFRDAEDEVLLMVQKAEKAKE